MVVAIKVLHLKHHRDFKSFTAECKALRGIRHRNLVKLITCCITRGLQEYSFDVNASTKGDVYSFGILLLEMFTGKKPTDDMFINGMNLREFVNKAYPHQVMEIVNAKLLEVGGTNRRSERPNEKLPCIVEIMDIGLSCSLESPMGRMDMRDVLNNLQDIKNEVLKFDAKRERGLVFDMPSNSSTIPHVIQPSL
ncbi:hypothetical protein AMTR_s00029p00233310 [Amborella trichopoda]|uniref:Serine-threonine/tyrosine-protein kinase catalytic domain-containing protein n=1 Tax=Amborella trichopoda TaxID=13333 RepID=W1PIE8_AMBTC|nr:hypothetical protein AMTR_s00029p00233310 [Amborella trichopoda]